MAKVISEFHEYVGISNDTWTDGLHPMITAAIPEFNPLDKRPLGEMKVYKAKTEDCIGNTGGCANVSKVKTVVCTYLGNGANHLIPCIHRGERVRIFNYAGTEQYYWREWGKDAGLRKCERIRWFAMDKKQNGKHWSTDKYLGPLPPQTDEYNDDGGESPTDEYTYSNATDKNTYFIEFNTNPGDKGFRIHTCNEDGEPFIYDISIWPEKGILEISDNASGGGCKDGLGNCPCHMDTGNNIRLNSKERWWHIRNSDDSCIDIVKENIFMKCKNTISMIAGKDVVVSAGIRYTRTAPVQNIVGNQRTATLAAIDTVNAPNQVFNGTNQVMNFGITKGTFKNIDLTGETYKLYAKTMSLGGDNFSLTGKKRLMFNSKEETHTGKSFEVFNEHGFCPVVIVIGSNKW